MNFYGSELWYKAIDNSDKYSITVMPSSIGSFTKLLEDNELCYYGFDNGKIGKISVNKSDIDLIKSLVGHDLAAVMKIEEIAKPYTPDDKNVFGTVEYKYIAKKTRQFLTGESETQQKAILRTAELLKRDGVKFSGRAYGDKVTLTLNEQDMEKATAYYQNALDHIEKLPEQIEQDRIANNIEAVIDKMIEQGFANDQIQNDYPVIIRELSSFRDVEPGDYLMYLNYEYTVDQNLSMFSLLKEIYESGGFDFISPSAAQEKLYQLDKEYKLDMLLRDYFDTHSFTDEQKAAVREICIDEGLSPELKHINETFSPAEIKKLHELWHNNEQETADKLGEIEQFVKAQQEGRTGIGYTDSFTESGKGTVLWTHRSFDDEKGESFRIYTVTYKEILLAKSLFDNDEDMLDYISKTATSYETKTLTPDVRLSYRVGFTKGEMYTAGDAAFLDRVAQDMSRNMDIFTLDDLAAFITDDVDGTISEDQLRQLIEGKTDELLQHGGADEKLSGYSRSDVLLLCSELRSSPFAAKISSNLTEKVKSELERKGVEVVKEKSFAEQVDEVLSGKASRYNDLKVCDTPQVLLDIGCRQLPMLYTQQHLRMAVKPLNTRKHQHGLNADTIKAVPLLMEEPAIIMDSMTRSDSLIVVLNKTTSENNPVIVSVKPNGTGTYELETQESNFITSIYGKEFFSKFIESHIENDQILYVNKEKSQELFSVLGLSFPKGLSSLDFSTDSIIHKSRNIVNSENEDNASLDRDNPTSVPMDTKLDGSDFDINEYDDPDYFEQQKLADKEEDETLRRAEAKFTDFAEQYLTNNPTVRNAFENSDKESMRHDIERLMNVIVTDLILGNQMIDDLKEDDLIAFLNEYDRDTVTKEHIIDTLVYNVSENLTELRKARETAKQLDIPFVDRLAEGGDDEPNPYEYDGSMSPEDFEKYQERYFGKSEREADLSQENPTSVPMEQKLENTDTEITPVSHSGFQSRGTSSVDDGELTGVNKVTIPQTDSPVNASVDEEKPEYLESETDRFYDYPGTEHIDGIYYNPDGNDGNGQYVTVNSSYDLILEARDKTSNAREFFDYLNQYGEVFLADRGDYFFTVVEDTLSDEPIFTGTTEETMNGMIAIAEKELSKQQQKTVVSEMDKYLSDESNLPEILKGNYSSDEIPDLAYALGIRVSHLYDKKEVGTRSQVAMNEFPVIRFSVSTPMGYVRLDTRSDEKGLNISDSSKKDAQEHFYSWEQVGKALYDMALEYELDDMYRDIIAQSSGKTDYPNLIYQAKLKTVEDQPYPIENARKSNRPEISGEYLEKLTDSEGYVLKGCTSKTVPGEAVTKSENDVVLVAFPNAAAALKYLRENKYIGNAGYGIREECLFSDEQRKAAERSVLRNGTFKIYQLPDGEKYHGIRFESLKQLHKDDVRLNYEDYKLVYDGSNNDLPEFSRDTLLDTIFTEFNTNISSYDDFGGHSLSVSDVVVTEIDGEEEAFYCDRAGWTEMHEFFVEKVIPPKELKPIYIERNGDFFEIYGEDARTAAQLLGLTVIKTDRGDMVGFPDAKRWDYEKQLLDLGYSTVLKIEDEEVQEKPSEHSADLSQEDSTSVPMDTKLNESEQEKEDDDLLDNLDLGHISDKRDTAWIDQLEKVVEQAEKDFEKNYGTDTKPQPSKSRLKSAVVSNVWSDFEYFDGDGQKFGVAEIDKLMKLYDGEIADRKRDFAANGEYYPTYTMEFTIDLPDGRAIEENRELGTGVGGLIDFLKSQGDTYADVIPQLEEQIERENKKPQRSSKRIEKQENDLRQLTLSLDEPPKKAERNAEKAEQTEVKTEQTDKPSFQDGKPDVSSAEVPQRTSPAQEKEKVDVSQNYSITDEHIGEGTKSERFRNNIEAIKTLKTIESENRLATPEEQAILAKYVGWGGLSECFVERHHSNAELRHNLTDEEYAAARESTMTAFYTPPVVMQQMYKKLGEMGFEGGRVLEPSCGVGNFIGTMPEDMQRSSDIHAVELDSISGRIAQKLYPAADVQVKGFEKTRFNDNSFDVAVGNVPFGDISVRDKQYDKHNWRIHNYFFGKSLDKVRPGGVVAFLTSRYTLDSKNSAFRQYLAQRADLLGAVRLPTGTFSKAAGTEVVSDIIFLQKRDEVGMPEIVPDWVQTTQRDDGFSLNKYFDEHPEMVLGEIQAGKGMGGRPEMIVKASEDEPLAAQLEKAMQNIKGTIPERTVQQREQEIEVHFQNEAAAPEDLRNYSLFVQNDQVYFKKDDVATLWEKGAKSKTIAERAKAFIGLRDMTRAILDAMVNDCSDAQLNAMQQELSKRYDDFKDKYGIVHSRYNRSLFGDDISFQLVAALESKYDLNVDPPTSEKSDLFTKRTIRSPIRVTSVDTAQEALAISMAERGFVDFDLMTELYEVDKETIIKELQGQIFPVPELSTDDEIVYQERSEYLSGDIRQKLTAAEAAAQTDPQLYSANIKALNEVMPEPLKAGDIDAKIGGAWIDPKYYEQFMYETFKTPTYSRRSGAYRLYDTIELSYSVTTNAYSISHKSSDKSVFSTKTFGMDIRGASAYDIFENLLNFRDTKIYMTVKDVEGNEKRVVDPEKTKLAANKAKKIQEAFSEWIFKDPERREYLVNKYNEMYNSIRPREYDGSALTFPGMNAEITLREHQKDAIAHAIYGGNTLFDHSVGAGKTFEMIASVMERKRLGLSNKALMCVPNHLTEQIGDDFQKLYPNANILVATKNDFSKNNRRALISKIATGDYDAVIIGHTQLGMIPLSKDTQEKYIQDEVDQLTSAIAEMKKIDGKSFGVKEAEKRKKNLQKQLDDLQTRKDDLVTFEELGVDTLVLDEAHEFKNLHTPTNMQNVSGIGSAASKKASDLYMKCQYLNEKTNNKGLIFATGTPISNSVTELFTMQRYLQNDVLKAKCISHFDQWIGMFGHKVTDYQIDPTGKKFKLKTRIAKYTNMTELMSMFKSVANIKTADMMKLDVPECETNIVNVEPTQLQQELVEELAFRADKVENGSVDPTVDNFLKITSDGRKVGLDPRLIDPDLPDDPETKLNKCVENVFTIYEDTAPDKLTQLIFCDLGVPNGRNAAKAKVEDDEEKSVAEKESLEETGPFCIYDDIKSKLIAKGVKPDEIAFIHDAKTEDQKAKLFEKVRNGEVRVLLGSTPKMGTGTNIQTRLAALHDLDVPWRPADLEQRLGRMVRQGNRNKKVKLFRYVTKGTFDAYSYQTLENKQRYIAQLYTGNSRTCEDVDQQSLSYSEIKTLCTGDERLKEVMQLDNDISNLSALKRDHTNTVYEMQDKLKEFQKDKAKMENGIEGVKKDLEICSKLPKDPETGGISFEIKIDGVTYTDKTEAAKQLERVFKRAEGELVHGEEVKLATMYGFDVKVKFSQAWEDFSATVSGNANYSLRFSESSHPTNIKRLMNIFDGMEQNLQNRQDILARETAEANEAEKIASTPFPKEAELSEKIERRDTLKAALQAEQAVKAAEGKDKPQTFHFSIAELKRNSKKVAQSKPPDKPQHGASAIE